ncbi:hypothetical protein [Ferruginibacter sp.]
MAGVVSSNNTKTIKDVSFIAFILVYTAALIFLCLRLNVSNDEIFSLDTTSNNLAGVIRQSYNFEGQPPAYFILLSLWRKISFDVFFARLFSVMFVALSAFVFSKFVKLMSGEPCSRWLIIIFLLNPYTVWTALEVRLYSFVLFISLTSVYYLLRYYISKKNKYLYIFVFTCLVGLYTQYLYVYLVASLAVPVLLFKGWKEFFKYCLFTLPVGLLLLHNLWITTDPMSLAYINSVSNTLTERMMLVFHSPQNLVLGMHMLVVARILRWVFLLLFLALAGYTYIKWFREKKLTNTIYFKSLNGVLISGAIMIAINSVFFAVTKLDYHDRYLTIAFPLFMSPFILFQVYPLVKRSIIFGTMSVLYAAMLLVQYRYQVKEYDTRSLTKYIGVIERKSEPILFYHKVLSLQFKYNYTGQNPLVPLPDGLRFDSSYLSKIQDTIGLRNAIEQANPVSPSYLLITDRSEPIFENDPDIKILNSYLPTRYNVTLDTIFAGNNEYFPLRIRRLEKK